MAVYTAGDYLIGMAILGVLIFITVRFVFSRIEFDKYFVISLIPPIIFAITIRLLADAAHFPKTELWSVTPGIYVLGYAYGLVLLILGLLAQRGLGIDYWKTVLLLGFLTIPLYLFELIGRMTAPFSFFIPVGLAAGATILIFLVSGGISKLGFLKKAENIAIIFAHMLDASGTYIGIDFYGFSEEHPLPEFFFELAGTAAVLFPIKLIIVGAALYFLEKWMEEEPEKLLYYKIIKITMFILGIGPGLRNSLQLTLV